MIQEHRRLGVGKGGEIPSQILKGLRGTAWLTMLLCCLPGMQSSAERDGDEGCPVSLLE